MAHSVASLQQCLQRETELVTAFLAALQTEAGVLAGTDLDEPLNACTLEKNRCANELAQAGQERDRVLQSMGYTTGKEGLDAACADDASIQSACDRLLGLVAQASDLNLSNGALIERHLKQNNEALITLRGLAGAGNLYDASGRSRQVPGASRTNIRVG